MNNSNKIVSIISPQWGTAGTDINLLKIAQSEKNNMKTLTIPEQVVVFLSLLSYIYIYKQTSWNRK